MAALQPLEAHLGAEEPSLSPDTQRQLCDYAGSLFSVVISPASNTTQVNERQQFRALPRDLSRRVEEDLKFSGRSPTAAASS
ncbi:MAG: hypothetical protein WAM75_18245 [Xanthobacteraceae bacterium]